MCSLLAQVSAGDRIYVAQASETVDLLRRHLAEPRLMLLVCFAFLSVATGFFVQCTLLSKQVGSDIWGTLVSIVAGGITFVVLTSSVTVQMITAVFILVVAIGGPVLITVAIIHRLASMSV
jgi:hypothetical protein